MSAVTSTDTPVVRAIGASPYVSLTPLAASPSTPGSTASVSAPSSPVKTWLFGIVASPLLQVHGHADEVDRERRLERHEDRGDAADLLRPRGAHRQLVSGQHLVDDHLREEAVERGLHRRAHADVVQL